MVHGEKICTISCKLQRVIKYNIIDTTKLNIKLILANSYYMMLYLAPKSFKSLDQCFYCAQDSICIHR